LLPGSSLAIWLVLLAAGLVLAGCNSQPRLSAVQTRLLAATLPGDFDARLARYQAEYQLAPRPPGTLLDVAETYMRRYQPGPEPRVFQSTLLRDRHGALLAEVFDEGRRIWTPLARISPNLVRAVVATEDASFYDNTGIDVRRIVGAIIRNAQAGDMVSGASTITMQLARNLFLPPAERFAPSADRKVTEVLLAQDLTNLFTKDEILELYLNLIYFGHLSYGAEAAAQTYFGKSAADLTMAEATLLAGLPQQPANLDPFENFAGAKRRQRIVLDLMVRHGELTTAAADAIFAEPLILGADPNTRLVAAPHFVAFLRARLAAPPYNLELGRAGLVVDSTLDLAMQDLAQGIVRKQVDALRPRFDLSNAALVALKPGTAEILAMVGSADFANNAIGGQVNVTLRQRQPGSALKPVIYAAAFDADVVSPATVLWDLAVRYPVENSLDYRPRNYDGKLRGPVTARMALANSLNVPTVKLMDGLGLERFVATANRMGVASLDQEDVRTAGLAMTLGGSEVTLMDLVTAYHTIAAGGLFVAPAPVLRIADHLGRELPLPAAAPRRAISPVAAFLVTDILRDNDARTPLFGANSALKLSRPAAAKTGTTTSFRDNWTVGFTKYLVAGVWAGNNDGRPMRGASGVTGAAPIWNEFMEAVLADPELLRTLGAPGDDAAWQFAPPASAVQIVQKCPPRLYCRPGGEFFSRAWLEQNTIGGAYMDAYATGLLSEVRVVRENGAESLVGVCLQERTASDDPDARTALALPRGMGRLAGEWRYIDNLPPVVTVPLTATVANYGELAIRPLLPSPGTARPVVISFAARVKDEQRAALQWAASSGQPLLLGTCAEAQGVAQAVFGNTMRGLTISEPPRLAARGALTTSVVVSVTAPLTPAAELAPSPVPPLEVAVTGAYVLASLANDSNCPGNYVMGRVLNGDGAPVAGVTVIMVDQWGNQAIAVSKSGAADFGRFDFPLGYSGDRELYLTLLDEGGNPASATTTIRYPPPAGTGSCYQMVWQRASG
jgi:penicillin-binding protein 1C